MDDVLRNAVRFILTPSAGGDVRIEMTNSPLTEDIHIRWSGRDEEGEWFREHVVRMREMWLLALNDRKALIDSFLEVARTQVDALCWEHPDCMRNEELARACRHSRGEP